MDIYIYICLSMRMCLARIPLQEGSPDVEWPQVVRHTSSLLSEVATLQPSDTRVMPDYVLPALARCASDAEESVRCALAAEVARLAETSQRFLDVAQWMRVVTLRRQVSGGGGGGSGATASGGGGGGESVTMLQSYDLELSSLQELISRIVVTLVTDPDSTAAVKRALLTDITRLAVFMTRQATNDLLLPLLITFLNDRDTTLRIAFFEEIFGVCAFVGRASLQAFVLPCILQVRALPSVGALSLFLDESHEFRQCELPSVGALSLSSLMSPTSFVGSVP